MIKKNDLAKQFELLTIQEVKNYQDSLNFVLQSIRELKDNIEEVKKLAQNNTSETCSIQCQSNSDVGLIRKDIFNLSQKIESNFYDQKALNEKFSEKIDFLFHEIDSKKDKDLYFFQRFDDLQNELDEINLFSLKNRESISENYNDLLCHLTKSCEKIKKEILSTPSEMTQVKIDLEEKMSSHKVDVVGIMRELTIYKKENMVTQKKIENIYMLIERLQEKTK